MVEEMLAAHGISVTRETIRQWGLKFGREFSNRIRRRAPRRGDKWHLDEVVVSFAGKKHWLWRAVDQDGFVLDVFVQSRRDTKATQNLVHPAIEARRQSGSAWVPALTGTESSNRFRSSGESVASLTGDGEDAGAQDIGQPMSTRNDRLIGTMFRKADARHARAFQADGRAINRLVVHR
jgi:putative transposase